MDIEIRAAQRDDGVLLATLNADVQRLHANALPWRFKAPGPGAPSPEDMTAALAKLGHYGFVASICGEPAGYVIAEIVRRPETGLTRAFDAVHIDQLSVRSAARRRGVGRALLNAAKARGEAEGIALMTLDSWSFNLEAQAFFASYGLVPYVVRLWSLPAAAN